MEKYTLLSGELLEFDAAPEVANFLARVRVAANNPGESVSSLTELIYGEANPMLTRGVLPGRGLVTREVIEHPAYHVMLDLLDQKRIQVGEVDVERANARYSMTVAEAAEQLGVTPSAVRQAIKGSRIAGRKVGGTWKVTPESVELYANTPRRGPMARGVLEVVMGNQPGASLSIVTDGDVKIVAREKQIITSVVENWRYASIKSIVEDDVAYYAISAFVDDSEPNSTTIQGGGPLRVRGEFVELASVTTNPARAAELFRRSRFLLEVSRALRLDQLELWCDGQRVSYGRAGFDPVNGRILFDVEPVGDTSIVWGDGPRERTALRPRRAGGYWIEQPQGSVGTEPTSA